MRGSVKGRRGKTGGKTPQMRGPRAAMLAGVRRRRRLSDEKGYGGSGRLPKPGSNGPNVGHQILR